MPSHYCELPVGHRDEAGRIHRQTAFRALTGKEDEILANRGDISSAGLVSELLAACVQKIGDISPINLSITRSLSVADRQYLLFQLRSVTFGKKVQAIVQCPADDCGSRIDIDFNIDQLPAARPNTAWEYQFPLSDDACKCLNQPGSRDVCYRLPIGEDQEYIAAIAMVNEAEALTHLLARCVTVLGDIQRPSVDVFRTLPSRVRREIETCLNDTLPGNDLLMDIDCPECGRAFLAPFNIQKFFFGELLITNAVLRKEVHYLAYHYHWSESEIMAMPRQKRRHYIETLSEEIERMNDAAQSV